MTLLKLICRRYLIRLWLVSIAYQTALISQSSPFLDPSLEDSPDSYYDSDPICCEVPCSEFPDDEQCYCDEECYPDPCQIKYYDPTTRDFIPDSATYQPPINITDVPYYNPMTGQQEVEKRVETVPFLDTLKYYDPRWDAARRKSYPPVDVDALPYYEYQTSTNIKVEALVPPAEPAAPVETAPEVRSGSVTDSGDLKLPPEQSPGKISNEPPAAPEDKVQDKKGPKRPEDMLAPLPEKRVQKELSEGSVSPRSSKQEKQGQIGSSGAMIDLTLSDNHEASKKKRGKDPSSHATKEADRESFLSRMRTKITSQSPENLTSEDDLIAQTQPQPPLGQGQMRLIAPNTPIPPNSPVHGMLRNMAASKQDPRSVKDISLSFNNVPIIEFIRYISHIAKRNFVFDDEDLQFNITVISEEMESIDNLMSALLQELQIRDLSLIEQANNVIIHRNPRVRAPARIVSGGTEQISGADSELVTRIFRLRTLDPVKASEIIRPILSADAFVEVLRDTNKLIITDLVANVNKIAQLIGTLDAPNSGVQIGQYVVRNAFVDSLVELATKILQPIAQGNPFILVPHATSNSIYVVSNEFIVQKTLAILENLDKNEGKTKILSLEKLGAGKVPAVTSQGAFGRGGARATTGVAPGVVGSEGVIPLQPQAVTGAVPGQPGSVPIPGQPGGGPIPGLLPGMREGRIGPEGQWIGPEGQILRPEEFGPEGQRLYPYGGEGEPGELRNIPPGYYPSGTIQSEGRLMTARGEQLMPGGESGFPYAGVGPGGEVGSQGYFREGPAQAFPYGSIGSAGQPMGMLEEGRDFLPGGISSAPRWVRGLPTGHITQERFFIYKLRYRKGDQIEVALRKIANSLLVTGTAHPELIAAINSSQWIQSSNSLMFTGTVRALDKIKELLAEVDAPLRQVFIEMLVLETDIIDSLTLGVEWITSFGGGGTNGAQAFQTDSLLGQALSVTNPNILPFTLPQFSPAALPLPGYAGAIIGTHLTHNGTRFSTIGALVQAVHTDTKINILLNPKIITEDNNPAEIFVGTVDRYKTQSITTNTNALVTNNFQFLDVGTTLRVTPLIGNNGLITLDIIEERSTPNPLANEVPTNNVNDFGLVPVISKDRTVTRVHVPDGFFVVLSGLIFDQEQRTVQQVPCLGGIPILGGLCKQKVNSDTKQNIMLFIRPVILDTDDDLEDVTKRQQDVWCEKGKFRRSWNYELDETLDQFNIRPVDPDDIGCAGCNQ